MRCTVGGPSLAGVSDVSICDACNEENYVIVGINPNNITGDSLIVLWVCMYSDTIVLVIRIMCLYYSGMVLFLLQRSVILLTVTTLMATTASVLSM